MFLIKIDTTVVKLASLTAFVWFTENIVQIAFPQS